MQLCRTTQDLPISVTPPSLQDRSSKVQDSQLNAPNNEKSSYLLTDLDTPVSIEDMLNAYDELAEAAILCY